MDKKKSKLERRKSTKQSPPWIDLPSDVTANILHRLGGIEILESAQKVCTTWRNVCKDPATWRVTDMTNLGDLHDMPYDLEIMCRHAVDSSQGRLIEINIEYFGTDDLLLYMAERSSQLRCLRLSCCYDIDGEGLSKAIVKFPDLEELHLIFMNNVGPGDIEAIGLLCPKLKSFTYNEEWYKLPPDEEDDDIALAVAKNMHGLCHLKLFGDSLTNIGVQAILDGCPHLESLDLRQCFNVALDGDLGKKCSQKIKDLRRPGDSRADYGWGSGTSTNDESFDNYGSSDYDDFQWF